MAEESGGMREFWDVVVVGGGTAGLAGAAVLARAGRAVVVVDPGVLPDGEEAPSPEGREEARRAGGRIVEAKVTAVGRAWGGILVALSDGRSVRARRLLVATGAHVDGVGDFRALGPGGRTGVTGVWTAGTGADPAGRGAAAAAAVEADLGAEKAREAAAFAAGPFSAEMEALICARHAQDRGRGR